MAEGLGLVEGGMEESGTAAQKVVKLAGGGSVPCFTAFVKLGSNIGQSLT